MCLEHVSIQGFGTGQNNALVLNPICWQTGVPGVRGQLQRWPAHTGGHQPAVQAALRKGASGPAQRPVRNSAPLLRPKGMFWFPYYSVANPNARIICRISDPKHPLCRESGLPMLLYEECAPLTLHGEYFGFGHTPMEVQSCSENMSTTV